MNNSGSVLITALWAVVLLSMIAMSMVYNTRLEIRVASYQENKLKMSSIEWELVKKIIWKMREDKGNFDAANELWRQAVKGKESGVEYEYSISDEESKLNINKASKEEIASFSDESIAESIIDWRDKDNIQHLLGAEDSYYANLEIPYKCKNAPFELIEELLMVKGVDKDKFSTLNNFFTVYGDGKININTVSAEVLRAMGGEQTVVDYVTSLRNGPDNEIGTEDDMVFYSLWQVVREIRKVFNRNDSRVFDKLVTSGLFKTRSDYYNVCIKVRMDRIENRLSVVLTKTGKKPIVKWYEG